MRNMVFTIVFGLTMLVGTFAFIFHAPHNLYSLERAHEYVLQSAFTVDQLEKIIAGTEGRRAALVLLGAAIDVTKSTGADVMLYQQQILDLMQNRGLDKHLLPNETKWIIDRRNFYCEVAGDQKRFADMLMQAEHILEVAPNHPDGLVWKGIALGRMGNPDRAVVLFEEAITSPAISAITLVRVAYFYFYASPQRAWKDRALPLLERALELEPQNSVTLRGLAEYRIDQNKCSDALEFIKQSVKFNVKDANAWGTMGNVYWCLGDKVSAKSSYRQAIQLEPRLEPVYRERLGSP